MKIKVSVLGYFTPGTERPDCRLLTHGILKTEKQRNKETKQTPGTNNTIV